jgi:F-type H+-transporting ATPase subunit alpha
MAVAEYFRDRGKKVLIAFDDLTTHAKIYREISLLLKRMPGRDSYPGDIFHIQASLLERAGNVNKNGREVSITALPVAETLENDLSGFIQTNLMAMTDGHIFFDINEFRKGKRPAVNVFLSVTRVGNQTKTPVEREIAAFLRKKMIEYQRVLELTQFGAELLPETQKTIEIGQKIELLLNQSLEILIPRQLQIILVGLLITGFWDLKSQREMKAEVEKILKLFQKGKIPALREKVEEIKNLDHLLFLMKEITPEIEKIIKS